MYGVNESIFETDNLPKLSLSELLYPAFNKIVPLLFENVIPYLSKTKNNSDVTILVECFH